MKKTLAHTTVTTERKLSEEASQERYKLESELRTRLALELFDRTVLDNLTPSDISEVVSSIRDAYMERKQALSELAYLRCEVRKQEQALKEKVIHRELI